MVERTYQDIPYTMDRNRMTLINGDSLQVLKEYPDNTFDLIVTDPPYGIAFMGKDWDKALPDPQVWKECFRVLKEGKMAFVMCSPRQDVLSRMIISLEDAGFRTNYTSIYWTYACLSEDTEVLTRDGWERFHNSNTFLNQEILCYDITNDKFLWEKPERWNQYQVKEHLYNIKSKYTDQLVSRNHRVFTQEGFIQAERLHQQENITYLSSVPKEFLDISCMGKRQKFWSLLFGKLQTKNKHSQISTQKQEVYTFNVRRTKTNTKRTDDGFKKQSMERWSNIFQNKGKLCWSKIYQVSKRVFTNGKERRLCNGTSNINSAENRQIVIENGSSSPYRSQSYKQQSGQSYVIFKQPTPQEIRTQPKYKTSLASITKQYYEGLIFCPTVSTGCFVARRNGKIFLTGNSGFPKAANISKLIDKKNGRLESEYKQLGDYIKQKRIESKIPTKEITSLFPSKTGGLTGCLWNWENAENVPTREQWQILKEKLNLDNRFDELIEREEAEREIIGHYKKADLKEHVFFGDLDKAKQKGKSIGYGSWDITKPATEQAKKMEGAYIGFQPKPAVEVILVVSKPKSKKTEKNILQEIELEMKKQYGISDIEWER